MQLEVEEGFFTIHKCAQRVRIIDTYTLVECQDKCRIRDLEDRRQLATLA